jgi:hypothetical protein
MDLAWAAPTRVIDAFTGGNIVVTSERDLVHGDHTYRRGERLSVPSQIPEDVAQRWHAAGLAIFDRGKTIQYKKIGAGRVGGVAYDELFGMLFHVPSHLADRDTGNDPKSVITKRDAVAVLICDGRLPDSEINNLATPSPFVPQHRRMRDANGEHPVQVQLPSGERGYLPAREAVEREFSGQVKFVNQVEDLWENDRRYRAELRSGRQAGESYSYAR